MQAARLYVANQDDATISVIDAKSRRLIETLDLRRYGFADNAKPHHVQVEPDGSAWYVTLIGAGKVLKLDRANRVQASADLQVPGLMTLHPTEDLMFVGRSMSAVNPPPRMAVIRRSDMKLLEEIDLDVEIDKLVTWAGGEPLGVDEVRRLATPSREEAPWALTDAWGARDLPALLAACELALERKLRGHVSADKEILGIGLGPDAGPGEGGGEAGNDPGTGERLRIAAPVPEDLAGPLRAMGMDAHLAKIPML